MATSIVALKELTGGFNAQPLLLSEITFLDGSVLRLSSENLDAGLGGPQWNSQSWTPRLLNQDLEALSSVARNGIIQSPTITLTINDGDKAITTGWELTNGRGFKGAKLKIYFVYADLTLSTFSDDFRTVFVGFCNPPTFDASTLTITADNLLNMTRKNCPTVRVQASCNWLFPSNAAQRQEGADNPDSIYYHCGYSPDATGPNARGNGSFTSCAKTYSDCVERMGNPALPPTATPGSFMQLEVDTSGRSTARFSGIYWNPPLTWRGTDYLTGNDKAQGINQPNDAKFNDYYPVIYGQAMVDPIIMNVEGDANSTRFTVALTVGEMPGTPADGSATGAVQAVLVNDLLIPFHTQTSDVINQWSWNTTGLRSGSTNKGPIFNGSDNVYGGIATLMIVVPKSVQASDGIPRVRVLMAGPAVKIFSSATPTDFFKDFTRNPIWQLLDMLQKADWTIDDVDLQSFVTEAIYADEQISYTAIDGTTKTHERYRTGLAYREPRTVAECLQLFLGSFRGFLYQSGVDGKLRVGIRKTLADQQPNPIASSNSSSPIGSVQADGSSASGYIAYAFNSSNIKQIGEGDNRTPSLRFSAGRPYADTPNRATVTFQDEEANYATDTLSLVDTDDVARIGQQIKGNLTFEGVLNYDQAFRLLESTEAEQFRGNPRTPIAGMTFDTGGTLEATLVTTAKVIDLRCGQICSLDFPLYGISNWLMRVKSIRYTADAEEAEVTLTYHKDEWHLDSYGQTTNQTYTPPPASAYSLRPPFGWCPDQDQPSVNDALKERTDWQFGISQNYAASADGSVKATLAITGKTPVNLFSAIAATPRCDTVTAGGGGTVPAGTYWVCACSIGSDGLRSAPSTSFPSATLTAPGGLTVSGFLWPAGTTGFEIYAGRTPTHMSLQASSAGAPSSVGITAFNVATLGSPDNLAHHFSIDVSRVWHPGIWTAQITGVSDTTITIANAGWTSNHWTGRVVSILGRNVPGTDLGVANFVVASNSADTLTVSAGLSGLGIVAGDTAVLRAQAGTASATTIGDTDFVSSLPILGSPVVVTRVSGTTGATVTTQTPHGLTTGDQVLLSNCGPASLLPLATPGKWTVTVVDTTHFTLNSSSLDPTLIYVSGGIMQKLNFGLVANAEVGRRITIFAGTGAGQVARVVSNTTTTCTIDNPWTVTPDATSLWLVEDDGPYVQQSTQAFSNANPTAPVSLSIPLPSAPNLVVRAQVFIANSSGARSLISDSPWREIYVPLPLSPPLNLSNADTGGAGTTPILFRNQDGTLSASVLLPQFADDETPTGALNGTNPDFALAHTPTPPASLRLYYNGVLDERGVEYSLTGNLIHYLRTTNLPNDSEGDRLRAWYRF